MENDKLRDISLKAVRDGIYYQLLDGVMAFDRVYLDYNEEYGFVLISKYLEYAEERPYKLDEYGIYWWLKEDKSE